MWFWKILQKLKKVNFQVLDFYMCWLYRQKFSSVNVNVLDNISIDVISWFINRYLRYWWNIRVLIQVMNYIGCFIWNLRKVSHPKYLLPNLYVGTSTVLGLFSSMTAHYLKEAIQIKKTWLYVGEKWQIWYMNDSTIIWGKSWQISGSLLKVWCLCYNSLTKK